MSFILSQFQTITPIILMYHGTPKNNPSSKYSIRADLFKTHLHYLKKNGWNTVLFRELGNALTLPQKTVVLTFDDGYADNYEGAFLPLAEYNMKATWFITTNCIGKHSFMMKSASSQTKMLAEEQLIQMAESGMEIGSHTCSHPDLSQLSYQQQLDEMSISKQILEFILQSEVSTFSYPFGRYNTDSILAVKDAGYKLACTTCPNEINTENNPLVFRRITILASDSASILAHKIMLAPWYYLPPKRKIIHYFLSKYLKGTSENNKNP